MMNKPLRTFFSSWSSKARENAFGKQIFLSLFFLSFVTVVFKFLSFVSFFFFWRKLKKAEESWRKPKKAEESWRKKQSPLPIDGRAAESGGEKGQQLRDHINRWTSHRYSEYLSFPFLHPFSFFLFSRPTFPFPFFFLLFLTSCFPHFHLRIPFIAKLVERKLSIKVLNHIKHTTLKALKSSWSIQSLMANAREFLSEIK